jgi:hypothetical protein
MADSAQPVAPGISTSPDLEFTRGLGLSDAVVVVGAMIGSGIFIVSADMARQTGSPGGLLTGWVVTAILTVAAARRSCSETLDLRGASTGQ